MNKWINPNTLIWAAGLLFTLVGMYTTNQIELSKLRSDMASLAIEIQADTETKIANLNTDQNAQMLTLQTDVNGRLSALSQDVAVLDQHVEDLENDVLRRLQKIESMLDQLLRRQLSTTQ